VASFGGAMQLFYLPRYSPDRNPNELVWKRLKADTVERTSIATFADVRERVKSSMRSLQRSPKKIGFFFQKPSLKYVA
jgi:transposase